MNLVTPIEPEDPAARTARHLRMLAELAELGMQLARATAAKALADLAAPDPEEQADEPQAAEPPPEPAEAIQHRTAPKSPGTASRKPADPVTSFIRLATAVCQIIALEAGLATGPAATARRGLPSPALRADPRRETLIKAFREVTEQSTNRAALRAELTYQLDAALSDDPRTNPQPPGNLLPALQGLRNRAGPRQTLRRNPRHGSHRLRQRSLLHEPAASASHLSALTGEARKYFFFEKKETKNFWSFADATGTIGAHAK